MLAPGRRCGAAAVLVAASVLAACGGSGDSPDAGSEPSTTTPTASATTRRTVDAGCTEDPPAWLPAKITERDFCGIVDLMVADLARSGVTAALVAEPEGASLVSDDASYGLFNLVQKLADADRDTWAATIDDHVDALLTDPASESTYRGAETRLRVAVYEEAYFPKDPETIVAREIADDLWATVVIDSPQRVDLVSEATLNEWQRADPDLSADTVFDTALRQTLVERPEVVAGELSTFAALFIDGDGDFFKATWLLDVPKLLGREPRGGALFVVPTRGEFIAHEVGDPDEQSLRDVVSSLAQGAYDSYLKGPNAIVDDVYWWYEGELFVIRTERGAVTEIPDALLDLVA